MSSSTLMTLDKDTNFSSSIDYGNSWLFSPVTWDLILNAYMQDELKTSYNIAKSLINPCGDDPSRLFSVANKLVNNSTITSDRILWELCNQQLFFIKDKDLVADSILEFYENHKDDVLLYDNKNALQSEHIRDRWIEIAKDIRELDNTEDAYFVFKNTSVDDTVETWFTAYNEETDESVETSLIERLKHDDSPYVELVYIEDNQIVGFKACKPETFS